MATTSKLSKVNFAVGFNRTNLSHLREVVERKLQEAADELGIPKIGTGSISFAITGKTASMKLGFAAPMEISKPSDGAATWNKDNVTVGMSFKWLARKSVYRVTAITPTHVSVQTQRGKGYRIPYTQLNTMIKL